MKLSILDKFCACLFCCCPTYNYYERKRRRIEIIYSQIRCNEDDIIATV